MKRVVVLLAILSAALSNASTLCFNSDQSDILLPGTGTSGIAGFYPITFDVFNVGILTDVNVTLAGLSHTFPDDLDILLQAPDGTSVMIMSDAGGGTDLVNADLTFDDSAADFLPDSSAIVGDTFKPTDYVAGDTLPAPAPGSWGSMLADFNGHNADGTWKMYIVDDASIDTGILTRANLCLESVPEPASLSIIAGMAGLIGTRLRRRRASK